MLILDETVLARLEQAHAADPDAAAYLDAPAMLARFQQRFPAERLRALSGTQLLEELHGRLSLDSLSYWLEFRDKPDFRTRLFGSIRGGSALKFHIYQRAEDNEWYEHGEQARTQRKLSISEAVAIAERQRDQMLRAREVVARLPEVPAQGGYETLQADIEAAAPNLASLAFLHKYLFLQFPDRLDDFHSSTFHAHHLLLMGCEPRARGLYTAAGTLIEAWHEFRRRRDVPSVVFWHLLNQLNGAPFSWWRVGTRDGQSFWPEMKDGGLASIGWPALGDLREVVAGLTGNAAKEAIREALAKHYHGDSPQLRGKATKQIWSFFARIQEGDHILAADGQTILGIGRVVGPYRHLDGRKFPHTRAVEWRSTASFKSPDNTGLQTTVYLMDGHWAPLLAAVRHLSQHPTPPPPQPPPLGKDDRKKMAPLPPLSGVVALIDEELRRKGQLVLYGPPGTGKTWHARRAAEELAARATFARGWLDLTEAERAGLLGGGAPGTQRIWTCTFHPSYGYEEFVEGLRPEAGADGQLSFRVQPGLFRRLCERAAEAVDAPHFLIIDEFNRGDAARIFGELLTLIEADKRGRGPVELPYSRKPFVVPKNVFLIATMNTADRSIALLDAALRRRFGFHELLPDPAVLDGSCAGGVNLAALLRTLNARILQHLKRDARNLQVGHSYFQRDGSPLRDFADLRRVLRHEVLPLLQEYCYDEPEALRAIVGERLIDPKTREIRTDLFAPGEKEEELRTALAEWDPTIVTPIERPRDDASEGDDELDDSPEGAAPRDSTDG
ncbi:McrB family protein [Sorangium sp. So ce513]|uniref:McrB family protein n=1 Tax=Sorangium sp. So ce513 TaxID=3133315 RepID=UPI003F5EBBAD